MATYKELEEALELEERLCTADQIQDLLRAHKGEEQVRITAESKEDLVRRNLRNAIEARSVALDSVFNLIREAEESGDQHVFYFRAKHKNLSEAMNLEFFAKHLWGTGWEKQMEQFPAIRLKPNDFRYADLHRPNPKKPKDWLLKIYGHSVITRATGKVEQRGQNTFWREFIEEPLRIVLVARWNNPDLLELRIQRNESRRRMEAWLQQIWTMLKPGMISDQFEEWDLSKVAAQLILQQDKNQKTYEFRDASVVDGKGGVHAKFQADSDTGNLWASEETKEAIKRYMEAKSACDALAITWLSNPRGLPQNDLRTMLGARRRNEMIVPGHCSPGDLDYVTDQLRQTRR